MMTTKRPLKAPTPTMSRMTRKRRPISSVVVPRAADAADQRALRMRIAIARSWERRLREIPDQPSARPAGVCSRTRKRSLPPRRPVSAPARMQPLAEWLSLREEVAHPLHAPRKLGRPGEQLAHLPGERLLHAKLPRGAVAEKRQDGRPVRRAPELADRRGRALPSARVEPPEDEARGRLLRPEQAAHEK